MKSKMKREFTKRKCLKRYEASKTARKKIDKKKYYGVKINVTNYKKAISGFFNDPKKLSAALVGGGLLSLKMSNYFQKLSSDYTPLLDQAKEILGDSFEKGSKRVLDNSGGSISLDEPVDKGAVDILLNQQTTYYDNLTEAQSRKTNKIIADGLEKGSSEEQIVEEIRKNIKSISNSRAQRIARTEIVKSHNTAQVETMKQAGIEEYNYITSNDKKVSKICRKNQGPKGRERIYKTNLAGTPQNPLPVANSHPNCRCTTVAYFKK